jgi:hypothetical membrane protein
MKTSRTTFWRLCGLFGAGAFLTLYIIAMSLDDQYVFSENYLSDLGVRDGALAFNSGLIIAGILYIAFALFGLGPELGKDIVGLLGTGLLVLSGVLLINIGIFTEDAGDIHGVISVAFFLETLVAIGAVDITLFRTRALGLFGPAVTTACFVFGIALMPFGGTPLVETLAVFDIIAWGIPMSVWLAVKGR